MRTRMQEQPPWWADREVKCVFCGRVTVLEATDRPLDGVDGVLATFNLDRLEPGQFIATPYGDFTYVTLKCPACGKRIQEGLDRNQYASLQRWIGDFGRVKFGHHPDDVGTLYGIIGHLMEEANELEAATPDRFPELPEDLAKIRNEAADIGVLLMSLADLCRFDLLDDIERKHRYNMRRTWLAPDSQGIVRHGPEDQPSWTIFLED